MRAINLTTVGMLSALIYIIYTIGSGILYFELLNFTILLYGVLFDRKTAYFSTLIFSLLVILTRGFGIWTIMYLIIFPTYSLVYSFISNYIRNVYAIAFVGFLLTLICGTLIDIPYIYLSGLDNRGLIIRVLLGLQVSIISAGVTFISTIFLLEPIKSKLELYNCVYNNIRRSN